MISTFTIANSYAIAGLGGRFGLLLKMSIDGGRLVHQLLWKRDGNPVNEARILLRSIQNHVAVICFIAAELIVGCRRFRCPSVR